MSGNHSHGLMFIDPRISERNIFRPVANDISLAPAALAALAQGYNERHEFKAGDVVQWKRGLKNSDYDGPFAVVEVLSTPVYNNNNNADKTNWNAAYDIRLGYLTSSGKFEIVHFDSRRFEPFKS